MGSFGKFIGGGLGFVLGGPIGALVGFALGSMFDSSTINVSTDSTIHNRTTEGDFKMTFTGEDVRIKATISVSDGWFTATLPSPANL